MIGSTVRRVYANTVLPLCGVIVELHSSLFALVTCLANLCYHLTAFALTLLSIVALSLYRLTMCLIETYLQMASIEAELKQSPAAVNGGPGIDNNNNKDAAVPEPAEPATPPAVENQVEGSASSDGTKTPPNTPAPGNHTLAENFKSFAKFGDIKSSGDAITLSNSDKWFKQAKIIDGKKITTTDTGIYFKQVAKTKKSLTLSEYTKFLDTLAKMKKLEIDDLKEKLKTTGPPATTKTTSAGTSGAFGRLTDHTKYTGSHRQRFDETGKGRGKAGREDVVPNTGYVTGFKA